MSSFNKVLLMGNLTRDVQLKFLPNQTAVAEFGIAVNRKFKGADGEAREDVTFVDVAAFGKQAEVVNQYFQKGRPIFIEGRLKFDSWEDKNGGGKRSKLSVVMENFQFCGGDRQDDGGEQREQEPARRSGGPSTPERRPAGAMKFKEEDIPFHMNLL